MSDLTTQVTHMIAKVRGHDPERCNERCQCRLLAADIRRIILTPEVWYELYIGDVLLQNFLDVNKAVDALKECKLSGHDKVRLLICYRQKFDHPENDV
jgi:hypothetical protein